MQNQPTKKLSQTSPNNSSSQASKYPNKEEILKRLYKPDQEERSVVTVWKKTSYRGWKDLPNHMKNNNIQTLLTELNIAHRGDVLTFATDDNGWRYYPQTKTIVLQSSTPSIISGLHELGHHLFGRTELDACQYSIGIFKELFSKAYDKLEFVGHQLKKT